MYHVLGTPQSEDVTILADPQHPTWMFGTEITHDGRWAGLGWVGGWAGGSAGGWREA